MVSAFLSLPMTVLVHSLRMKNTWYEREAPDPAGGEKEHQDDVAEV